ncbi:MAG TPA: hypothetical protein VEA79_03080, partial [Phenylobacterium sp.]|nr:hypothetical protein [Phenylobacterium sp.]
MRHPVQAGDMREVILAPAPMTPQVERLEACAGQTIAQILTQAVRQGLLAAEDLYRTEVYVDGQVFEDRAAALDYAPAAGELVNIAVVPHGGGGGRGNKVLQTILTIAIIAVSVWVGGATGPLAGVMGKGLTNALVRTAAAAAVTVAGAAATNALFGPKGQANNQAQGRDRYGLTGQSNQGRPRQSMPLVLGKRRVWFDLCSSAYTSTLGEDVYLHAIFGVHYGPCVVEELKLGETLVANFEAGEVEIEAFLEPGPRQSALYPMRTVQESYTDQLEDEVWITHTTADDAERIEVDFAWPAGLYYVNEKGKTLETHAHVAIQIRPAAGGDWAWANIENQVGPEPGAMIFNAASKDPLRRTAIVIPPEKGQWDIRVTKAPGFVGEGTTTDQVFWTALRSLEAKTPIIDETLSVIFAKFKATGTINGTVPAMSAVVEPIVPVLAGDGWETEAPSSNAAALARWLLTGPAAAMPLAPEEIDASCATAYSLIEEREWQGGLLLAGDASQEDALVALGRMGRFSTYWNGQALCFVTDWEKPLPRQMFTGRNVQGYRYRRSFPEAVHAVRVEYDNIEKDCRPDELVVFNDGQDATTAELYETLSLDYATTPDRAYREGRVYLAKLQLTPESHEWTASADGLASTYGDRVLVRHSSALIGLGEARVLFRRWSGGLVSGVRLDQPVIMEAGKAYEIDVRRPDGVVRAIPVQGGEG